MLAASAREYGIGGFRSTESTGMRHPKYHLLLRGGAKGLCFAIAIGVSVQNAGLAFGNESFQRDHELADDFRLLVESMVHDDGLAYRTQIPLVRPNERDNNGRSLSRLFEDDLELGPRGVAHSSIRLTGGGAFSHWGETLYFSSSDGSDPRTNGRRYVLLFGDDAPPITVLHRIAVEDILADVGHGWRILLPEPFHAWIDDAALPGMSRLVLLENGRPLPAPHSLHGQVREHGLGAYSHWRRTLYFSTSDNSDPRSNGRRYEIALGQGPDHHIDDERMPTPPVIEESLPPPILHRSDGSPGLAEGSLHLEVIDPDAALLYYWEVDIAATFDSPSVHRRPLVAIDRDGINPIAIMERRPDFSAEFTLPYRVGALAALTSTSPNTTPAEHLARRLGYGLRGPAAIREVYGYVASQIYRRDNLRLTAAPERTLLGDRGLCSSTNALATAMLETLGFSTRLVNVQNPRLMSFYNRGLGSHVSAEVFYDGRWSIFDPWLDFHLPGVSWRDIQEGHPVGETIATVAQSVKPEELEALGIPPDSTTVLLRHFADGQRTLYAGFYQYGILAENAEQEAALFSGEPRLIPDPPFELLWPDETLDLYVRVRGLRLSREDLRLIFLAGGSLPGTVQASPWTTTHLTVDLRQVYDQGR